VARDETRPIEGKDLSGVSYRGEDLRGIVFVRCDLTEADFTGANLEGAAFRDCQLQRARLSGCRLAQARLESSDMSGALADGLLAESSFFAGVIARAVQWSASRLDRSEFNFCDLTGSVLRGLSAQGITLEKVNAERVDFMRSDLSFAYISRSSFLMASLAQTSLIGATLSEVQLAGADLAGALTERTEIEEPLLSLTGGHTQIALRALAPQRFAEASYPLLAGLSGEAFRLAVDARTGRLLAGGEEVECLKQFLEVLEIPYKEVHFEADSLASRLQSLQVRQGCLIVPYKHKVSRDSPVSSLQWGVIFGVDPQDNALMASTLLGGETLYSLEEVQSGLGEEDGGIVHGLETGKSAGKIDPAEALGRALQRTRRLAEERQERGLVRGVTAYDFLALQAGNAGSAQAAVHPLSAHDLAFHIGARRAAALFIGELAGMFENRCGEELGEAFESFQSAIAALEEIERLLPEIVFEPGDPRRDECMEVLQNNKAHIVALFEQTRRDESAGVLNLERAGKILEAGHR